MNPNHLDRSYCFTFLLNSNEVAMVFALFSKQLKYQEKVQLFAAFKAQGVGQKLRNFAF